HLQPSEPPDPGRVWRAVTYFSLWTVRLAGLLPELHVCLGCGVMVDGSDRAWFVRGRPGLVCADCRRSLGAANTWELSAASRSIAEEMLRSHVGQLSPMHWAQETAADIRRFLVQQMETHMERRLITAAPMEQSAVGL